MQPYRHSQHILQEMEMEKAKGVKRENDEEGRCRGEGREQYETKKYP